MASSFFLARRGRKEIRDATLVSGGGNGASAKVAVIMSDHIAVGILVSLRYAVVW
jgi:hypothetical protein